VIAEPRPDATIVDGYGSALPESGMEIVLGLEKATVNAPAGAGPVTAAAAATPSAVSAATAPRHLGRSDIDYPRCGRDPMSRLSADAHRRTGPDLQSVAL